MKATHLEIGVPAKVIPYLVETSGPYKHVFINGESVSRGKVGIDPSNFHSEEGIIWQGDHAHYIKSRAHFSIFIKGHSLSRRVIKGNTLKKYMELVERDKGVATYW